MQENEFKSTNNLDFKSAEYKSRNPHNQDLKTFKIGTCLGVWGVTKDGYQIYKVTNTESGNGHFQDVIEWFEFSCKRDNGSLIFVNIPDGRLKKHLINKKGFKEDGQNNLIKEFDVLLSAN